MATHALGSGTRNLSINIPADERDFLGRLGFVAVQNGEANSIGAWLRDVLIAGVKVKHGARTARRIKEIRRRYYGSALLGAALIAGWQAAQPDLDDDEQMRRSKTVAGIRIVRQFGSTRLEMEVA